MDVWKTEGDLLSPESLSACVEILRSGGVIILPTETVYGIAASALHENALSRLKAIKGRSAEKTLPIQVGSVADLASITAGAIPHVARCLFERFSPGPITVVMAGRHDLPKAVRGPDGSVGIRIPDHPAALQVLRACGFPLAVSSANRSGERPAPDARAAILALAGEDFESSSAERAFKAARDRLRTKIDGVVDAGSSRIGAPSTVVKVTGRSVEILRAGALPETAIFEAVSELSSNAAELSRSTSVRADEYA